MNLFEFIKENGLLLAAISAYTRLRQYLFSRLIARRLGAPDLFIGRGAYLRGLAHIRCGTNFRAGVCLRLEALTKHNESVFKPQIIIGNDVSVSDHVHIGATNRVEIGNGVLLGSRVFISDHNHGCYTGKFQSSPATPPQHRPVTVGKAIVIQDNVWIGEQVCILPGVSIGAGAVIGAGSVVTKDVPAGCIAVGNPARVIRRYDSAHGAWHA